MTLETAYPHFPTLNTARLTLRQVQGSDAEALFEIKSDPQVTSRYGQEPHRSLDTTRGWIQRLQASYAQGEDFFWCLTLKGEDRLIGACVLWNFQPGDHCAEIGYELNPVYQRQGLMPEAVSAVLTFAFEELDLHRVEACPFAGNTPSKNLLLKLGFIYEGNLRQRHFFHGEYLDQVYYSLLKDEWTM